VACLVDKSEVELDEHLLNVEAEEGLGSVLGHHAPWQLDDFLTIKHSYRDCDKQLFLQEQCFSIHTRSFSQLTKNFRIFNLKIVTKFTEICVGSGIQKDLIRSQGSEKNRIQDPGSATLLRTRPELNIRSHNLRSSLPLPPVLRIPDHDFYPFIPDPGPRISDPGPRISDPKTATKERGEKKNCCQTFFCSHKLHIIENYFIF
jgi:hypothetical protein